MTQATTPSLADYFWASEERYPDDADKPADLVYRLDCPYPITGARVTGQFIIAEGGEALLASSFYIWFG